MEDTIMKINKYWTIAALVSVILCIAAVSHSADRIEAENLFVEAQKKLSAGDDTGAERLLKESLQNDPAFTSAIWQLAQIYESRGKLEHARELLLRGLEQSPSASWAREKLKRLEKILIQKLYSEAEDLMGRGEYTAALPKLSLYHGIKPYDPVPLINLARCHLALGHPETARNYLSQGLERDPENNEIISLISTVDKRISENSITAGRERAEKLVENYSESNREEVKKALEALLSRDPSNRWAKEKLEELNLLAAAPGVEENSGDKENAQEGENKAERFLDWIPSFSPGIIAAILVPLIIVILVLSLKKKGGGGNYSLQGNISLIPILDIVSLINSNLKTGWLEISGERGSGKIFFKRGEIIHARYKAEYGNEAFHAIMGIKNGRYIFYNHLPKIKRTITDPLSLLLLSLKSRNEAERNKGKRRSKVTV
ncbi:MAG: tetratricopeptide repeat protein [Candidatus Latescibacteria bacterium]|nr:tetratricopeptide repeat protein [bacterium]MBD3423108.1 tetratricopeptide repeat protein [Candidatus Latescibacterota bacterium]